jgi:hypothetical protein
LQFGDVSSKVVFLRESVPPLYFPFCTQALIFNILDSDFDNISSTALCEHFECWSILWFRSIFHFAHNFHFANYPCCGIFYFASFPWTWFDRRSERDWIFTVPRVIKSFENSAAKHPKSYWKDFRKTKNIEYLRRNRQRQIFSKISQRNQSEANLPFNKCGFKIRISMS